MSANLQEAIDWLCESLCERLDHQTAAIDRLADTVEDLTYAFVVSNQCQPESLHRELFFKRERREQ